MRGVSRMFATAALAAALASCEACDPHGPCEGPEDVGKLKCSANVVEECREVTPGTWMYWQVENCEDWQGGGYHCEENTKADCAGISGDRAACCVKN
jgi:hypothetical protein